MRLITLLFASLFVSLSAFAEVETTEKDKAPPKIIVTDDTGKEILIDDLEPEVTITPEEDGTVITEYKIRGRVYLIKVEPKNAPPYYLHDPDGDGDFNRIGGELDEPIQVPMWVIKTW